MREKKISLGVTKISNQTLLLLGFDCQQACAEGEKSPAVATIHAVLLYIPNPDTPIFSSRKISQSPQPSES